VVLLSCWVVCLVVFVCYGCLLVFDVMLRLGLWYCVGCRCEFVVRFDLLVLFRLGYCCLVVIFVGLVFACFRLLVIVLRLYFYILDLVLLVVVSVCFT